MITYIGYIAACLTTGAFIPQVYKTYKTRSTEDLSLLTFSMLFIGTVLWTIYGFVTDDHPLFIANSIMIVLSGTILGMKLSELWKLSKS